MSAGQTPAVAHPLVLIGNWDRHKRPPQNGFGIFRFDSLTGALDFRGATAPEITVGAAWLSADARMLYCVDEYTTLPGYFQGGGGRVLAYRIDSAAETLTPFSNQPSYGNLPSFVCGDASGRFLVVTHHTDRVPVTRIERAADGAFQIELTYDDATTVLFPLGNAGEIGDPCDVFLHRGDGGPLPRQTHPQLHCVSAAPRYDLFAVTDKGNDAVLMFRLDGAARKLAAVGRYDAPPGSSPRYLTFAADRDLLFVNHETQAIVSTLRYRPDGQIEHVHTASALPDGVPDDFDMKLSDLQLHPSGRFLCTLVRGISAASIFSIDALGKLTRIQTVALDGNGPRGCAYSPDGRHLVIAAWESREVLVWRVAENGTIASTGQRHPQPNPGTVTFLPGPPGVESHIK